MPPRDATRAWGDLWGGAERSSGEGHKAGARAWRRFGGRARDKISKETGLLKEWPKEGPPLAWKVKGVGDAHSSVAVANGKIYTAGKEGDSVMLFALNEADGKQGWEAEVGGRGKSNEGQGGMGPRGRPA